MVNFDVTAVRRFRRRIRPYRDARAPASLARGPVPAAAARGQCCVIPAPHRPLSRAAWGGVARLRPRDAV